jgi:hypothetical protein
MKSYNSLTIKGHAIISDGLSCIAPPAEEIVVYAVRQVDLFLFSLKYLTGAPNLVVSKEPAWIPKGQKK